MIEHLADWMPIWMFITVAIVLLAGYPVAFTLASAALPMNGAPSRSTSRSPPASNGFMPELM